MNNSYPSEHSDILPFKPVTISDKATVDKYMRTYGECSCQHSFATLFTLSDKYGSCICERDGFLFTLREGLCTDGKRVYLAPMGEGDLKSAYSAILRDAEAHGCRAVFNTLTRQHAAFLIENFPGRFQYTENRDYAEYIYSTRTLYRMDTAALAPMRSAVKRVLRRYGDRLELSLITPDSLSDIWEFVERWFAQSPVGYDESAVRFKIASIRKQLDYYDALELLGIGAYIDGKMVGFSYGAALGGSCFDGMIIEAQKDISELYSLLYWGVSCLCAPSFKYFNWEEDVGAEGLRSLKLRYAPIVLMRKYLVEEKAEPGECEDCNSIAAILAPCSEGRDIPCDIADIEK